MLYIHQYKLTVNCLFVNFFHFFRLRIFFCFQWWKMNAHEGNGHKFILIKFRFLNGRKCVCATDRIFCFHQLGSFLLVLCVIFVFCVWNCICRFFQIFSNQHKF